MAHHHADALRLGFFDQRRALLFCARIYDRRHIEPCLLERKCRKVSVIVIRDDHGPLS